MGKLDQLVEAFPSNKGCYLGTALATHAESGVKMVFVHTDLGGRWFILDDVSELDDIPKLIQDIKGLVQAEKESTIFSADESSFK